MAEKRQNARAEVEKAETPETPEAAAPGETPQPANTEEPKKPRRGRPPKAEKAATENQKAEKSAGARKGRPPKADKAAPDKPKPSKRDKVSRSDGKAPDAKEPIKPAQDTALKETAAVEQTAPEPTTPPRPVEEGKLVYLKLSEVHPFHTFRPHPFKVRDDAIPYQHRTDQGNESKGNYPHRRPTAAMRQIPRHTRKNYLNLASRFSVCAMVRS